MPRTRMGEAGKKDVKKKTRHILVTPTWTEDEKKYVADVYICIYY